MLGARHEYPDARLAGGVQQSPLHGERPRDLLREAAGHLIGRRIDGGGVDLRPQEVAGILSRTCLRHVLIGLHDLRAAPG